MASPFDLLEKIPLTRRVMEDQYAKRASQIFKRIRSYIGENERIIDIGSGTGFVAKIISEKQSPQITLVDVRLNPLCKSLPVVIYDGKTLPFPDNHFKTALLIAVLHHCHEPMKILDEAIRVSTDKIIVMEDLFESPLEKWLTLIEDSIVNWEFRGHPHNNKLEDEWFKIFRQKNLKVLNFEKFRLVCAGFPFRLGIFVLQKEKPKK